MSFTEGATLGRARRDATSQHETRASWGTVVWSRHDCAPLLTSIPSCSTSQWSQRTRQPLLEVAPRLQTTRTGGEARLQEVWRLDQQIPCQSFFR